MLSMGATRPEVFTSKRGAPFTTAGFALANKGHETLALQANLGHKNIQQTVRYSELVADEVQGSLEGLRRGSARQGEPEGPVALRCGPSALYFSGQI
jgi:hypothetical protein